MGFKEEILHCETFGPVPMRVYAAERLTGTPPVVLHLHGGQFLGGSLDSGHRISSRLSEAGAVVVSVAYCRDAGPFPAALTFVFDVLGGMQACCKDLAARKSQIFVAGEEAGGNLAAGVALMARDRGMTALKGQILLAPMLDPFLTAGSLRQAEAGGNRCNWAEGWSRYLGIGAKACHPYAAPATCSRLAGVVPALVVTAEDDPMRDESLNYARRLREAGVTVRERVLAGATGWPRAFAGAADPPQKWEEELRDDFAAFFRNTGALPA